MWHDYFKINISTKLWNKGKSHSNLQKISLNQFTINDLQIFLNSGGMVYGYNYRF